MFHLRSVPLVLASAFLITAGVPAAAQQEIFRPLYLSGRVVMEDGNPPPETTIIELWCGGQRQPQEYTDKEGKFNFRVGGDRSRAIADSQRTIPGQAVGASGSDRSYVSLTNCELQAALPGYTSSKIYLGRRSVFESSDVGTLVLKRAWKGEGSLISVNTLGAPENAKKAFDNAQKELEKKKPNRKKAVQQLEKAVQLHPQFAAAWNLLGENRATDGDLDGARQAFEKAREFDPKFVPPCLSLALLELKQQRPAEAAKIAASAIQLLPELPEAHYYNAIANMSLGNLQAAEASIRTVHGSAQVGQYPRIHFMLGNILAQKGSVAEAAKEFEEYLQAEPNSQAAGAVRGQLDEWKAAGLLK